MLYRYILKKQLKDYESQGWEYIKDIEQYITGKVMKEHLGFSECLIRKQDDNG